MYYTYGLIVELKLSHTFWQMSVICGIKNNVIYNDDQRLGGVGKSSPLYLMFNKRIQKLKHNVH